MRKNRKNRVGRGHIEDDHQTAQKEGGRKAAGC